jgi:hypothetical protein|nr:MAG TPA: Fimbrillin-like [Caudoviricetes sp.]
MNYKHSMMKRKSKQITALILACLLAAGCTQADMMTGDGVTCPTGRVPLAIGSADVQTGVPDTRAAQTLGAGASIGVFLNNASGVTSYTPMKNVRYDCVSTAWNPVTESVRIYLTSDKADVCAYYPYDTSVTGASAVSLTPRILADGISPLAYATNQTVDADNKNVTFSMTQACSWLVIDFKRGNIKDDITLSEFSLTNSGLYKEYVLNITDGSTTNTAADGGTVTFSGDIALPQNSTVTRSLSMPPSPTLTGGVKVSVKVKEYGNKVLSITLTGLTALARGYKYAVTLTVDGTELGVASVEVLPWTESTVNNGGNPFIPLP